MALGQNIRRRRREMDISQTTLAERVGVHLNTIHRIERGHTEPSLDVLRRIAVELGTTATALAPELSTSSAA